MKATDITSERRIPHPRCLTGRRGPSPKPVPPARVDGDERPPRVCLWRMRHSGDRSEDAVLGAAGTEPGACYFDSDKTLVRTLSGVRTDADSFVAIGTVLAAVRINGS